MTLSRLVVPRSPRRQGVDPLIYDQEFSSIFTEGTICRFHICALPSFFIPEDPGPKGGFFTLLVDSA